MPTGPFSTSTPEKHTAPQAAPEFIVVPLRGRGRMDPRDIDGARRLKTHAAPATLTGQIPGSVILGPLGAYVVGSDGVPVRSVDLDDLQAFATDVVADLIELRTQVAALVADAVARALRSNRTWVAVAIQNGTTAGCLKLAGTAPYTIGEIGYAKSSGLDDLWNLSALATLDGTHYRATLLFLDASGTASIASGSTSTTSAGAIASAMGQLDATKAVIGCFVGAPNCNYANALTGQSGCLVILGMPVGYTATASTPAALETTVPS